VGIAATGFCYLGGILQLFHRRYQQIFSTSSRSTNFAAAGSSSQIASANSSASDRLHHQQRRVHQASRLRSRQKFSALASEPTESTLASTKKKIKISDTSTRPIRRFPSLSAPLSRRREKKVTSSKQLFQPYGSSPDVEIQIGVAGCFRILVEYYSAAEFFRQSWAGDNICFQSIT
jgi:hypothetical protein